MFHRRGQDSVGVGGERLSQCRRHGTDFVIAHNRFVAGGETADGIARPELDPGRCARAVDRRAIHHQDVADNGGARAVRHTRPDLVVREINDAAIGGVTVERIPLPIHDRVRNAGVTAGETRALVVGARRAEVCQRQVGKIEVAILVDSELGVAAAGAGVGFTRQRRGARNPLKSFARVKRAPDPTGIRAERARHTRVEAIRIRWIDAKVLLEAFATNAADHRMAERRRRGCRQRGLIR